MANWQSVLFGEPDGENHKKATPPRPAQGDIPGLPAWSAGQVVLDDYLIEKELGRGGMGQVWLVKSNTTGKRFAVKKTLLKDEKSRKAFLSELQTWIDMPEHPNIVPCRFFRTVGNEIVIFSDYIDGGSLAEWIAANKFTNVEQILDVAIQFAWGLHAIHEQGVIHQDIKPGNILMTADGVPMVADFGLARAKIHIGNGSSVSPDLSSSQQSVLVSSGGMTPAYASPEQRAGKPLSRKTDIWSWGVCVLDMFMGGVSCPHGGFIAAEVLKDLCDNRQQAGNLLDMPRNLCRLLSACFETDPALRFGNLELMSNALQVIYEEILCQPYSREEPVTATNDTEQLNQYDRQGRLGTWREPREWLHVAYAALGREPKDASVYAALPAAGSKGAGVSDLLIYEEAEQALKEAIRLDDEPLACSVSLAGLYHDKSLLHQYLHDVPGALQACANGIKLLKNAWGQKHSPKISHWLIESQSRQITLLTNSGDLHSALSVADESIAFCEQLINRDSHFIEAQDYAGAQFTKANILLKTGDFIAADALYSSCIQKLKEIQNKAESQHGARLLSQALMNKAIVSRKRSDYEGAARIYDECLSMLRRLMAKSADWRLECEYAQALMNKAIAIGSRGIPETAVALLNEAIDIFKRLVQKDGRHEAAHYLSGALAQKGNYLRDIGDLTGAVAVCRDAVKILRQIVITEGRQELSEELALSLFNMASKEQDIGESENAVNVYDECLRIYMHLICDKYRYDLLGSYAKTIRQKAEIHWFTFTDKAKAIELLDASIALHKDIIAVNGTKKIADELLFRFIDKAAFYGASEDFQSVIEVYSEAVSFFRNISSQNKGETFLGHMASALVNLSRAFKETGNLNEALQACNECIVYRRNVAEKERRCEAYVSFAYAILYNADLLKAKAEWANAVTAYNQGIKLAGIIRDKYERKDLNIVVARHEIMRASCILKDGNLSADEISRALTAYALIQNLAKQEKSEYYVNILKEADCEKALLDRLGVRQTAKPSSQNEFRKHHYYFAHKSMPDYFMEQPEEFIESFRKAGIQHLRRCWDLVGENLPSPERLSHESLEMRFVDLGNHITGLVFLLPPPKYTPEAYFIAMVYRSARFSKNTLKRVFTLEYSVSSSGIADNYLCEWAGEEHYNHGEGPTPNVDDFIEAVKIVLSGKRWQRPGIL